MLFEELQKKYPPFDPTNWIPPTFRDRKDKDGTLYRNIRYNRGTKTHWYEMKLTPNDRWSGPYHGRTINQFLKMDEL